MRTKGSSGAVGFNPIARRGRGPQGGFTLVEVLASLVIGAVIMGALLAFLDVGFRQTAAVEKRVTESAGLAAINAMVAQDVANANYVITQSAAANVGADTTRCAAPSGSPTAGSTGVIRVVGLRSKMVAEDLNDYTRLQYIAVREGTAAPFKWDLYRRTCTNPDFLDPTSTKIAKLAEDVPSNPVNSTSATVSPFSAVCVRQDGTTGTPCLSQVVSTTANQPVEVRLAYKGPAETSIALVADSQASPVIDTYLDLKCARKTTAGEGDQCGTEVDPVTGTGRTTVVSPNMLVDQVGSVSYCTTVNWALTCLGPSGAPVNQKYVPSAWKSFTYSYQHTSLAGVVNNWVYRCDDPDNSAVTACVPANAAAAQALVDDPTTVALDLPTNPVNGIRVRSVPVGRHEVTVTATDSAGTVLVGATEWNVTSAPPVITALAAYEPVGYPGVKTPKSGGAVPPCAAAPCPGVAFVFEATISDPDAGASIAAATWDWGDGTTSPASLSSLGGGVFSAVNNHGYFATGTYTVSLSVTDNEGATATSGTVTLTITGNLAPTVTMTASSNAVSTGASVTFTANPNDPDGTISSGVWDFGDGSPTVPLSLTGTCPACSGTTSHAYATSGVYIARVTVFDNQGGFAFADQEIIVGNRAPTGAIVPVAQSGAADFNAAFSLTFSDPDPGGSITASNWNFGDIHNPGTNTSNLPNPTHNYTQPGTYTVSLTVTDNGFPAANHTSYATVTVTNTQPVAVGSVFINKTKIGGPAIIFSSAGSYDPDPTQTLTYQWSFGDGTSSTAANPTRTYTTPGVYDAVLTVFDGKGGSDSVTVGPIYVGVDNDGDGWYLNGYGGVFQAVDCDDSNVSRNPGATDIPYNGIDENCDGLDGTVTDTIFVRGFNGGTGLAIGTDSGTCGTLASPCRQISHALGRAAATGAKYVYATRGKYTSFFTGGRGVEIAGNFSANFAAVTDSLPSPPTAGTGVCATSPTYTCVDGSTTSGRSYGVYINGATPARKVTLRNVEILGQVLPAAGDSGASVYGVLVWGSPAGSVVMDNVNIRGGKAERGANGPAGANADLTPAGSGSNGGDAVTVDAFFPEYRVLGGGGGAASTSSSPGNLGAGGKGGDGGQASSSGGIIWGLFNFSDASGGRSGSGGFLGGPQVGTPAGSGAGGGSPETCDRPWYEFLISADCLAANLFGNYYGGDGADGGDGSDGIDALGGAKGVAGNGVAAPFWEPAPSMNGQSGGPGVHGAPGGGGGGGGGSNATTTDSAGASGGGGGGGGDRADAVGSGGSAGGASIALYLVASEPTLTNVRITLGTGGNGGTGGVGGRGQPGGPGGIGGFRAGTNGGNGGDGGDGGDGSDSGSGGGGAGGPAFGIAGVASVLPSSGVTYTAGSGVAGTGGNGGAKVIQNSSAGAKGDNGVKANSVSL